MRVCVCVCVCVCACACWSVCYTHSSQIAFTISSSPYCRKLLDEVVKKIKIYSLVISVIWKIWVANVVLLWLGLQKPLKASGFPILRVKSGKEITRTSGGSTTGEPWKSMWSFFISVKNQNLETKIIANIWKLGYTVKPFYSRHLQFLKKLSAIRRCPL